MKLYSVTEFAREKGIHRSTVLKWVKNGKIQGLIIEGRSYLIPEENLSIPVQKKRKSKKKKPILMESQAREAYANTSGDRRNKLKFTYDELKEMFDEGMTLESVALAAGVTKQRVSQVYNQFFSFGIDGYERRSAIQLEIARDRGLQALIDSERIAHLGKAVVERGLSMKPVQTGTGPYFHKNAVEINGHLCKIHISRKDTKFAGTKYRSYSRILVTGHFLDSYEFVIAVTGEEGERKIFIIPTGDLKGLFRKGERRKPLYLPTSEKGAYRTLSPILDWWKYLEAWRLLESSD